MACVVDCSDSNYKTDPKNASGTLHQLWYDDPATLAQKYKAIKGAGLAAVGMWTADSAGSNALTAGSMWESVPSGK
jgi:spore germination protein YaaH